MTADERVQPLNRPEEAPQCAEMMLSSEPWITLGLTRERALALLLDPAREIHAIRDPAGVAGFVVIDMRGLVAGYVHLLCVRPDCRGSGIGSTLMGWAEERIFRDSPNVFICVSSFNDRARRLYQRLGYERVGALRDFVVRGHDEILLRKSRGSWSEFRERLQGNQEEPMKKLHFSTLIDAPRARVWETMLAPDTYRIWTAEFAEGSTFEGSWDEGARIVFLAPEGNGMIAVIERNVPHELISIRHLGTISKGVEDTTSAEVQSWAGAHEDYRFSDAGSSTRLDVDMDVTPEFETYMAETWPKALAKLKELCEQPPR